MIISFPLSILQLVLFNAAKSNLHVDAAFTFRQSLSSLSLRQSGDLNTARNSALFALDPVVEAYQKKKAVTDPYGSLSYSDEFQASDAATAATTASTPPTTPTPDVTPQTDSVAGKTDEIVEAFKQAVSTAIDASDKASEAAASISSPTAAIQATTAAEVTAAASAVSASVSPSTDDPTDKLPTLFEFMKGAKLPEPTTTSNIDPGTKEKLVILKNNLLGQGSSSLGTSTNAVQLPNIKSMSLVGSGAASISGDAAGASFEPYNFAVMFENFKFEEYGAWYVTAFTVLLALNAGEQGRAAAEREFKVQLAVAQEKADVAACAALEAAEGARLAKNLAEEIPKAEANIGQILLETSKLEEMRVDKEMMNEKILELTVQLNEQQKIITKIISESDDAVELEKMFKVPVSKFTMDPDPKETDKILGVIKEIDEVNAEKKAVEAKLVAENEEKMKKKKAATAAKRKATRERNKAKAAKSASSPEGKASTKKAKAPKKAKTAKSPKKVVAEKAAPETPEELQVVPKEEGASEKSEESQFFETSEESFINAMSDNTAEAAIIAEIKNIDANAPVPAPKKTRKTRAKKKTQVKTIHMSSTGVENPWGVLKESTLKRKTIAQLSAYLAEREVDVAGFSKKDLVGTIQTL